MAFFICISIRLKQVSETFLAKGAMKPTYF